MKHCIQSLIFLLSWWNRKYTQTCTREDIRECGMTLTHSSSPFIPHYHFIFVIPVVATGRSGDGCCYCFHFCLRLSGILLRFLVIWPDSFNGSAQNKVFNKRSNAFSPKKKTPSHSKHKSVRAKLLFIRILTVD